MLNYRVLSFLICSFIFVPSCTPPNCKSCTLTPMVKEVCPSSVTTSDMVTENSSVTDLGNLTQSEYIKELESKGYLCK